jgi:hypothetical protein
LVVAALTTQVAATAFSTLLPLLVAVRVVEVTALLAVLVVVAVSHLVATQARSVEAAQRIRAMLVVTPST